MSSGAEKIVSNILSQSQAKADKIIQEAEAESKNIVDNGSADAELEKQKILDEANKSSNLRYQQIISEAKMKGRRLELDAREEVIEEAFNKATEKIKDLSSGSNSQYINSLESVITEAGSEIGGGNLVIHVKQEDKSKIEGSIDKIAKTITLDTGNNTSFEFGEAINTIGGAVVKTSNGDVEVNNTIESRILRYKKSLRLEVANILFK
ncbi:V-type ATP synthase subunit E [Methanobrevibacter curvatus]|uniref:A-type ATP synthase subunit E n=1 Tax=Methanobrevibacter curvatus TaxID=49547 RepID=A0A165Z8W2_9EURY|nr:V-type proton ATPase subunit E [Methanobrevibacter curvatus]KZX10406.1 V-type proton ATPase subunit E [Methanobrevibacter curvatus]